MFFLERIASPDYSGLNLEERQALNARVAAYFATQRIAATTLAEKQSAPVMQIQEVRTIDMSLPANGRPAFAEERA